MKRTTELDKLKAGEAFTWGDVIQIHEVGDYSIVECHPWEVEGSNVVVGRPVIKQLSFHVYVSSENTCSSFESLDAALAGCIAYKHEGVNHRADTYFMKMIRKEK